MNLELLCQLELTHGIPTLLQLLVVTHIAVFTWNCCTRLVNCAKKRTDQGCSWRKEYEPWNEKKYFCSLSTETWYPLIKSELSKWICKGEARTVEWGKKTQGFLPLRSMILGSDAAWHETTISLETAGMHTHMCGRTHSQHRLFALLGSCRKSQRSVRTRFTRFCGGLAPFVATRLLNLQLILNKKEMGKNIENVPRVYKHFTSYLAIFVLYFNVFPPALFYLCSKNAPKSFSMCFAVNIRMVRKCPNLLGVRKLQRNKSLNVQKSQK